MQRILIGCQDGCFYHVAVLAELGHTNYTRPDQPVSSCGLMRRWASSCFGLDHILIALSFITQRYANDWRFDGKQALE